MIDFKTRTQAYIFFATILLLGIGLIMIASASQYIGSTKYHNSFHFLIRQSEWLFIGLIAMYWIMKKDYQQLRNISIYMVLFALVLLVIPPLFCKPINGANRWIVLGPLQFQPSEFAKLALIVYLADLLSRKKEAQIKSFSKGFVPILIIMGLISCLVLIEPDMGTAVLLFIIGTVLCLIAGMKLRHFALMCPFGLTILLYEIFKNKHQLDRIMVYFDFLLNPHIIRHDAGYHVSQSLLTIGSGGIMGLGLGKGMQKFGYLPDCHTDFIFAIICEELGMIGAVAILLIFGFLIWQGVRVALFSSELFASLLAAGVTAMIAAQVAINMGMATSLLPAKGMPLPFISYGGSSVLFMLIAVGILLNVSQYMPENREKQLIKRMGFNETFK